MTESLFRSDAYARSCTARVMRMAEDGALVVDRSVFYPAGGGQPGDSGWIDGPGGRRTVVDTRKEGAQEVALVLEPGDALAEGDVIEMHLDWDRRYRHMRVHTALHLLSVVIPLPVTGGAIGAEKGRLDFDMPEAPEDKEALEAALNALISRDLAITERWITDDEMAANMDLVKTMSVKPPMGQGRVRLVRIGTPDSQVDLQPCGGTHVRSTAEIGRVTLGKIEKKGKQNRRVSVILG